MLAEPVRCILSYCCRAHSLRAPFSAACAHTFVLSLIMGNTIIDRQGRQTSRQAVQVVQAEKGNVEQSSKLKHR